MIHLVSRRTSDSDATLDDLTLFGVTAVLMGELWLLVIHPFAPRLVEGASAQRKGAGGSRLLQQCAAACQRTCQPISDRVCHAQVLRTILMMMT